MTARTVSTVLIASSLLAFAGCRMGPDFERPSADVPAAWDASTPAAAADAARLAAWWKTFDDTGLQGLVEEALASSPDMRLAAARMRESRARLGVSESALWPSVDASGAYSRSGNDLTRNSGVNGYRAGLDAAWELDIFGGKRRSAEAAEASLEAAEADAHGVRVSLAAEVAVNYLDLKATRSRLAIAREQLASQERSLVLARQRHAAGVVSGLDVANAEAAVAGTSAQLPSLQASEAASINALAVLLGTQPAAMRVRLASAPAAVPSATPVPAGLPSELLRRRPDIRAAEARLHAAIAGIGVATSDLYPRLTLTGNFGYSSAQLGSLFDASSRSWSVGPGISWPVFDAGRIRSNIKVQEALGDQAGISYTKTVLAALGEVDNALVSLAREHERQAALTAAADANRRAADIATQLYTQGQTDFINVLNAQRSLLQSEDALLQSRHAVNTGLIKLYKALGGGWE